MASAWTLVLVSKNCILALLQCRTHGAKKKNNIRKPRSWASKGKKAKCRLVRLWKKVRLFNYFIYLFAGGEKPVPTFFFFLWILLWCCKKKNFFFRKIAKKIKVFFPLGVFFFHVCTGTGYGIFRALTLPGLSPPARVVQVRVYASCGLVAGIAAIVKKKKKKFLLFFCFSVSIASTIICFLLCLIKIFFFVYFNFLFLFKRPFPPSVNAMSSHIKPEQDSERFFFYFFFFFFKFFFFFFFLTVVH